MVLVLNGIPVFAFELKTSTPDKRWMMPSGSGCMTATRGSFASNSTSVFWPILCGSHRGVDDHKARRKNTYFLPFNQGSNGAGNDGGKGNPANPNGYPTAYLWENVFQKDSMMDIVQKFMNLKDGKR